MPGRQTAESIEVFHKINNFQPRLLSRCKRAERGSLGNLGSTSARYLGYILFNLFITSDTSAILGADASTAYKDLP
jgi:hypothetical protein